MPSEQDRAESQVVLSIVFLSEHPSMEKVYFTCEQIAKKRGANFLGIFLYALPTNPSSIVNSAIFTNALSNVNDIAGDLLLELKLSKASIRVQLTPAMPAEKPMPQGIIS